MRILLLAISLMILPHKAKCQSPHQQRVAGRIALLPRITELHLTNPLYQSIPENGTFTGVSGDRILYRTTSRRGKLNGTWISWYPTMLACDSGNFKNGLPDGEWRRWDGHGQLVSVRTYSADRYRRITQQMAHANPKAVLYPLTRMYRRDAAAALKYLHADYSFPQHDAIRKQTLEEHVLQNTSQTGTYHPVFHRGIHHGLFMNVGAGGAVLDSGYYKNGLREGAWMHCVPGDGREQGAYRNSHRIKEWKKYNAAGKLVLLSIYDADGVLRWQKLYDGND